MCGIAGYIGERKVPRNRIEGCLARMRRRGPDHADFYEHQSPAGQHVCLLHSRLSILDLDPRAHQPYRQDGGVLVFNGEIYNYLELREEMAAPERGWRTTGDTEVLAELLARRGPGAMGACEGMWGLAWYDEARGGLTLSRDRFGEKPLYLWRTDQGLYFGSEVKFLAALAGRWPEVNLDQIFRFLVHGFRALNKGRESFFKGVEMLSQASNLTVGPEGEDADVYWTPVHRPEPDMTYEEAVAGAREKLIRSMQLRLRADVPLAFCMSGGVDSNGMISIATKVLGHDVHGFTFTTDDARYDEMDLILRSVKALGIRHTVVHGKTDGFLPRLRELVRYHDAPVITVTWYANWMLMESIAAGGYKISINGIAADELFSGYYDHHLAYLHEMRSHPALHAQALDNWRRKILPVVRNPYLQNPDLFLDDPGFRGHNYLDAELFASYLKRPFGEDIPEKEFCSDLLRNRMLNELFFENVPVYMHEEDLNAMYYSIENRTPYLDGQLFTFCNTIPSRHLIQNGMAKSVLRDALRGVTPDEVLDCSKKVGFNAPIMSFLDTSDAEVMDYLMDDGPIYDYVQKDAVRELCNKDGLSNAESKFLFAFLNCKMFLEDFA